MQKALNTLWIIYVAFVFSSLIYLIVGFALLKSGWQPVVSEGRLPMVFFIAFSMISVTSVAIALKIRRSSGNENVNSRSVIQFALSEVPAILGLVLFFLTGNFADLLLLCVLSLGSFVIVRPRP